MSATMVVFPKGLDLSRRAQAGSWSICLCCRRAFVIGHVRVRGDMMFCPYLDCDGRVLFDVCHWEVARSANPTLPDLPSYGVVYDVWGAV